jgi:hypothetical protein
MYVAYVKDWLENLFSKLSYQHVNGFGIEKVFETGIELSQKPG